MANTNSQYDVIARLRIWFACAERTITASKHTSAAASVAVAASCFGSTEKSIISKSEFESPYANALAVDNSTRPRGSGQIASTRRCNAVPYGPRAFGSDTKPKFRGADADSRY